MRLAITLGAAWASGAAAAAGARPSASAARAFEFDVEALGHPFSALAGWLCDADGELLRCGPRAVRRALLALSMSSKGMKAVDGTVHGLAAMGASAASGASVSEEFSAARDISGRGKTALRKKASAVFRANVVEEAFQAAELIEAAESPNSGLVPLDGAPNVCVSVRLGDDGVLVVVMRWASGFPELLRLLEGAANLDVLGQGGATTVNAAFWQRAKTISTDPKLVALLAGATSVHCVGHGAGGSVAALVAAQLSGALREQPPRPSDAALRTTKDGERPTDAAAEDRRPLAPQRTLRCSALTLGAAPCISRTARLSCNDASNCRVTSIALGDDLVCRLSKSSLTRLRRRLRRFLPSSRRKSGGFAAFSDTFRLGAALAGSAFDQRAPASAAHVHPLRQVGAVGRATKDRDDLLALPGDVLYLKPRSDGSVGLYDAAANRARKEILWQLNDVLLSKSMLAHHALGSYINSLERA